MKIILSHWTKGGTGVTNFCKSDLAKMESALEKYGNPNLVICSKSCATPYYSVAELSELNHSLHCVSGMCDLSDFWDIYFERLPIDKSNEL